MAGSAPFASAAPLSRFRPKMGSGFGFQKRTTFAKAVRGEEALATQVLAESPSATIVQKFRVAAQRQLQDEAGTETPPLKRPRVRPTAAAPKRKRSPADDRVSRPRHH
eukprot:CAMPEP_0204319232 /NCGR_PEP_ID=MMETSP0469-20131031/6984_1 /ASSEMBLY_ACC=CAM_ASM_000384 /TAXON_ID=2969 /ORGANISM="Oxyrrhis marina" /LENGTH=107 /DNA_ID=CAMNT_0051300385 /DNA_START=34 /DNA_END=357 /DNA_ORIENTATION=+